MCCQVLRARPGRFRGRGRLGWTGGAGDVAETFRLLRPRDPPRDASRVKGVSGRPEGRRRELVEKIEFWRWERRRGCRDGCASVGR